MYTEKKITVCVCGIYVCINYFHLYRACTPLPQRPSAANSYYNPLSARVDPSVPDYGVLYDKYYDLLGL